MSPLLKDLLERGSGNYSSAINLIIVNWFEEFNDSTKEIFNFSADSFEEFLNIFESIRQPSRMILFKMRSLMFLLILRNFFYRRFICFEFRISAI